MTLLIAEDATALSRQASKWLEEQATAGARSVFLPAGKTPEDLYELWESTKPAWLKALRLQQIDDVLTGPSRGVFRTFFEEKLPSFKVAPIDRADQPADVAILGLGLNGHIAFHEPHLPENFYGGCVELNDVTCRTLRLENGTWGLTYGAATFRQCRAILMIASGPSKREVVAKLLARSKDLPATSLLAHPAFTLLVDRAAHGS